jgi:hypothetical protein
MFLGSFNEVKLESPKILTARVYFLSLVLFEY